MIASYTGKKNTACMKVSLQILVSINLAPYLYILHGILNTSRGDEVVIDLHWDSGSCRLSGGALIIVYRSLLISFSADFALLTVVRFLPRVVDRGRIDSGRLRTN